MYKTKHPLYNTWLMMRRRCNCPTATSYKWYGEAGVKVCPEWEADFWQFVADVGERPDGCTLDRYPNKEGNYEPSNVRWASRQEQADNKAPYPKDRAKFSKPRGKGYSKRDDKYYAVFRCNGKNHHLGVFDCPLMAHLAYLDAWNNYQNNLPIKPNA